MLLYSNDYFISLDLSDRIPLWFTLSGIVGVVGVAVVHNTGLLSHQCNDSVIS